jgi:hypothetical protein
MKNTIYVAQSDINGDGLFTIEKIKEGEIIGVSHVFYEGYWYMTAHGNYNHSKNPNCFVRTEENINLLIAKRNIESWEELIVDYTKQLYLEQPKEDWK